MTENRAVEIEELKAGDSFENGYCPNCGNVGVKITGAGYHPSGLAILLHIVLSILSSGAWLVVWCIWGLLDIMFNKGTKTCVVCQKVLNK